MTTHSCINLPVPQGAKKQIHLTSSITIGFQGGSEGGVQGVATCLPLQTHAV